MCGGRSGASRSAADGVFDQGRHPARHGDAATSAGGSEGRRSGFEEIMQLVQFVFERGTAMRPFTIVAVGVFALVALLQLVRFVMQWEISINGMLLPLWASAVACVIAAALAVLLAREARR